MGLFSYLLVIFCVYIINELFLYVLVYVYDFVVFSNNDDVICCFYMKVIEKIKYLRIDILGVCF